ncbi:RNA polymerase sigma factor [Flagellimonas allohymeniacidonis]|uniref:Sigma-70 family RNA polymerase sigma factor n=1 Tax=Flagellimonas allohymeniacidonis TaxID=2517819 RepID=A0A4Q8QJ76_9FLAO|nr:sigma-70 family RNA polymerase sigma factor [Allomuricauda hymeniacidonis]TAI48519.1 sigma-70 family RNA polymerase sigma factor [Allomuricauda hymeniacidonis]
MDLEHLIQRFQLKDTKAFEKLYEMYATNICGVINSIVQDDELSQEICQDVFMKVWQKSDSYNSSKGRFFTWLLNIARNAAIDELRSKSHKEQKLNLSADLFVGILDQPNESENDEMNSSQLKNWVVGLKQKCKQIIDLLYFKGYSQKEVAEALDIPLGTVKTRNRNCISQLRENMKNN